MDSTNINRENTFRAGCGVYAAVFMVWVEVTTPDDHATVMTLHPFEGQPMADELLRVAASGSQRAEGEKFTINHVHLALADERENVKPRRLTINQNELELIDDEDLEPKTFAINRTQLRGLGMGLLGAVFDGPRHFMN